MDFKKIVKDKRVIYGGAGVLGLIIIFVFLRGRGSAKAASDEGNSDTGFLYYPTDFTGGSIGGGSSTSTSSDPTASLLELTKSQIAAQTKLGLGSIGADFMGNLFEKLELKNKFRDPNVKGLDATFGFDESGMLDFNFKFQQVATVPSQPKQNNNTLPTVNRYFQGGNAIDARANYRSGGFR